MLLPKISIHNPSIPEKFPCAMVIASLFGNQHEYGAQKKGSPTKHEGFLWVCPLGQGEKGHQLKKNIPPPLRDANGPAPAWCWWPRGPPAARRGPRSSWAPGRSPGPPSASGQSQFLFKFLHEFVHPPTTGCGAIRFIPSHHSLPPIIAHDKAPLP